MTPRSLSEKFYEDACSEPEDRDATWLVVYDFEGSKPSVKFWVNLGRLASLSGGSRLIQRSVFLTRSRRVALALRMLVKHYGGVVEVFRGSLAEI